MDKIEINPTSPIVERIASIDFFRGFTMFLLIGESTQLYSHFSSIENSSIMQFIGTTTQPSSMAWIALLGSDTTFFHVYCRGGYPICSCQQDKKRRLQ